MSGSMAWWAFTATPPRVAPTGRAPICPAAGSTCWLAGTADVVADDGLDLDCAAMLQGEQRYSRAHNFDAFMSHFFPNNNFNVTDVPGIGHDSAAMFASPQGIKALFFAD